MGGVFSLTEEEVGESGHLQSYGISMTKDCIFMIPQFFPFNGI